MSITSFFEFSNFSKFFEFHIKCIMKLASDLYFSGRHVRFRVIRQINQRAQVEIHDHVIAITSKTSPKAKISIVKARI